MAWSTPRTWSTGEVVTAAMLNGVRDQLIDLDRRTTMTQSYINANESTASLTYTDLATPGPSLVATVGSTGRALVTFMASMKNDTANTLVAVTYQASGANSYGPTDFDAASATINVANAAFRIPSSVIAIFPASGATTFAMKYRVGSGGVGSYLDRRLIVTPLGS